MRLPFLPPVYRILSRFCSSFSLHFLPVKHMSPFRRQQRQPRWNAFASSRRHRRRRRRPILKILPKKKSNSLRRWQRSLRPSLPAPFLFFHLKQPYRHHHDICPRSLPLDSRSGPVITESNPPLPSIGVPFYLLGFIAEDIADEFATVAYSLEEERVARMRLDNCNFARRSSGVNENACTRMNLLPEIQLDRQRERHSP